jgi:hypothetical protein
MEWFAGLSESPSVDDHVSMNVGYMSSSPPSFPLPTEIPFTTFALADKLST